MDSAKCAEMESEVLAALTGSNTAIVFDLEEVDFISSAFLRLCIHGQREARDHGFHVVNVGPYIKRVFKIAGLDAMLATE
jgi:anti-anti-sigma factor